MDKYTIKIEIGVPYGFPYELIQNYLEFQLGITDAVYWDDEEEDRTLIKSFSEAETTF